MHLFHDAFQFIRKVNPEAFVDLVNIEEILGFCCLTFHLGDIVELTQVRKHKVNFGPILTRFGLLRLFVEEVESLLGHNCVVSLKGHKWRAIRNNLWDTRPS